MEIITVKLNGKEYPTHIDKHGVQRYVANPIIRNIVSGQVKAYDKLGWTKFEELGLYGLNEVSIDYQINASGITLEQMLDFYTQMGYSVSGMMDISHFEDVEVENPFWD